MKALYIAFQPLQDGSGISKKIYAQYFALKELGLDIEFCCQKTDNGRLCYVVDGTGIIDILGSGLKAHMGLYCRYAGLRKYILENHVRFVYIRYIQIATPFFLSFLKILRKNGVIVFLEIPTFPYDGEYKAHSFLKKMQQRVEKKCRTYFYKYVDRIVTYSNDLSIFGIPTIRISNGLDMAQIPLRNPVPHQGVNLICVAMFKRWHGIDRLVEGLRQYYSSRQDTKVYLRIIGNGNSYFQSVKDLVSHYSLDEYVTFEGIKTGKDLDALFDDSDLAIGCLACHRKNVYEVRSLKNVEYAARGIPFIYSECNDDFDGRNYVYKIVADESPVHVGALLHFIADNHLSPLSIRKTIESDLSWVGQMEKVCMFIKRDA